VPQECLELGPVQVSIAIEGRGVPVVCVHGSGMSGHVWRRLQARLAESFETFAPDLIGYGQSSPYDPTLAGTHATSQDVAVVEAVIRRALRDKPAEEQALGVHLVGHSYGGLLALAVAYGGRVPIRSVVAYEPVAFGLLEVVRDTEGLAALRAADPDGTMFTLRDDGLEGWLRRFIDFWNGAGFWDAMPPLAQAPYVTAQEKVYAEVRALLTEPYDSKAYASIRVPVLLLSGGKSPIPARRVCAVLAGLIPGATLQTIENAGHVGPLSQAGLVNEAIARHLNACESIEAGPSPLG
jgi:pimeloyl-ACP methyl ester carboxylesterase